MKNISTTSKILYYSSFVILMLSEFLLKEVVSLYNRTLSVPVTTIIRESDEVLVVDRHTGRVTSGS